MPLRSVVTQVAERELVQIHGTGFLNVFVTHDVLFEGLIRTQPSFLLT